MRLIDFVYFFTMIYYPYIPLLSLSNYTRRSTSLIFSKKKLNSPYKKSKGFATAKHKASTESRSSSTTSNLNNSFLNIIPSLYVKGKYKPIYVYLNTAHFHTYIFREKVSKIISIGNIYTVFLKVRFDYNHFLMAGNQFGFNYSSIHNVDYLFKIIINRL